MNFYKFFIGICLITVAISFSSCKKYLDAKPDKKLVVPTRLTDLQAMLDYTPHMFFSVNSGECSADDYYLTQGDFDNLDYDSQRRMYTWEKDHFYDENGPVSDWGRVYKRIYICNTVLDALPFNEETSIERNNIAGQALFVRGIAFWEIASVWAMPYDPASSSSDMGIPLRLNADFNEKSVRASLKDTYDQILKDLTGSLPLLPNVPLSKVRASKGAAYGYLARVYLSMNNYVKAGLYADSALQINNRLIDYNGIDSTAPYPFTALNDETVFHIVATTALIDPAYARIDSNLVKSYLPNDLRLPMFFMKNFGGYSTFKGSYTGNGSLFSGIATDELLLIRAECNARLGNTAAAMNDLNTLLIKRFKTGTFIPYTASSSSDALKQIIVERRKELLMRTIRWVDIRRLNKEGANIILTRKMNNNTYTLQPNSIRYALPIPEDVINLSGMQQNPR